MELDPALSSGRKIFEHINEPQVQAVIDDWIQEIIFGLTSLIHIFNPSCVIVGGGIMMKACPMCKTMRMYCFKMKNCIAIC